VNEKIYKALTVAQQAIQPVAKDATNAHQKYQYASAESIIIEARQALGQAGLAFYLVGTTVRVDAHSIMVASYQLVHESGETLALTTEFPVVPGNGRPLDKAVAIARTSSLAYMLRDLLLMPRVDETDEMNHDKWETPRERKEPPPRQSVQERMKKGGSLSERLVAVADAYAKADTKEKHEAITAKTDALVKELGPTQKALLVGAMNAAMARILGEALPQEQADALQAIERLRASIGGA